MQRTTVFLATLLTMLLALACSEAQRTGEAQPATDETAQTQEAPAPAEPQVQGYEVGYEVGGVALTGYLAFDAGQTGPRPGVLVVHEWWGHNEYVRKRAEMLAEMGYTAFALDMYGDGKLADHPADAEKFMTEVFANMDSAVARFAAAQKLLEDHETTEAEKTAAIGYCFGGAVVLHMARIGTDLDAVASFHGNLSTEAPAQPGAVRARILVAHGADDPFVAPEQVDAFRQEMAAAGADMKFVAYPGVKHSFTNPDATEVGQEFELPLVYDEEADHASWQELETFLEQSFAGGQG